MTPVLSVALALLALQGGQTGAGAEVTASVDRTRLTVGEELKLTVRARTRSADAVQISLPSLNGFAIVGSRDLTEVAISGASGSVRTTVRELQLRAEQPGALLIGPVRARQGQSVVTTDPILVTVDSAADRFTVALSPLARALLDGAPPPASARGPGVDGTERVALTMLVSSDTVLAGQQVDLVAAAWIPRQLRERMRRPPILTLVTPEGVWAYPAATSSGVAATRVVGGRPVDLFITHQIVFPLAAGRVIVPPASVEYALPVTFSFFSREERYHLRSDSVAITVLPLPPAERAASVVGQALSLDLRVDPASTRVGEPIEAAATIRGIGNVALWPEPVLRWPTGFRLYPAQTEVRVTSDGGRVAGSKTFKFLAVPDSAGSFVLPDVRYPYYDVMAGRYQAAVTGPRVLAVAPGPELRAARALPPLLPRRAELAADRVGRRIALFGWGGLGILLAPPLVVGLVRRRRREPEPAPRPIDARAEPTELGRLEREFLAVLASHVSDRFARDGDGLAQALRAAGVDSAVADHVKRLRDRLRAARYGPRGLGDAAELSAEIQQVLRVLGADGPIRRRRPILTSLAVIAVAVVGPARDPAQTPGAEALYEAGALRAAADSFAARAEHDPRDAAHWYNLGATLYRAGADGKAAAAWTRAARLAPRDATIRRARRLLAPPDLVSEQLLLVGWATPAELALIAGGAWVALWLSVLAARPRRAVIAALGAIAVGAGLFGAGEWRRRTRTLAVVVAESVPVRAAPYGGASAAATVPAGGALVLGRSYGPWREVRRGDGVRGWVLDSEIVSL